jgi:hypothetical protein
MKMYDAVVVYIDTTGNEIYREIKKSFDTRQKALSYIYDTDQAWCRLPRYYDPAWDYYWQIETRE